MTTLGLPWYEEPTCQCRRHKRLRFDPWVGRSPGGGHGNPLQYSCLENAINREAWQATVPGVTRTQLKRLSARTCKTTVFDDLLEGLTGKLSSDPLWFTTVKAHKSHPAKNTGTWDRVQEKPGKGSGDAL